MPIHYFYPLYTLFTVLIPINTCRFFSVFVTATVTATVTAKLNTPTFYQIDQSLIKGHKKTV